MTSLEEDAANILPFMASNGLVANPSKTEFMLLNKNNKEKTTSGQTRLGSAEIEEVQNTKLLGIMMDNDQKRKSDFWKSP